MFVTDEFRSCRNYRHRETMGPGSGMCVVRRYAGTHVKRHRAVMLIFRHARRRANRYDTRKKKLKINTNVTVKLFR